MDENKFRYSIIDFLPFVKEVEVGRYADGSPAYLGDVVKYNGEKNYFIVYRYGQLLLKQVGMMAMLGLEGFGSGDFSRVVKTNIIGAGADWVAIGYGSEPMIVRLNKMFDYDKG